MLNDASGLNPAQRAAISHVDGPSAVYAGPGSGKTRVVALRTIRLAQLGKRLLVTTFTNDATEEMRARILPSLPKEIQPAVQITTLHALCLRILRSQGVSFQLLTDAVLRRGLAETAQAGEIDGGINAFLQQISYQKNTGISADRYKPDGSYEDMVFIKVWRAYEKLKTQKNLKEFDDMILEVSDRLGRDNVFRTQLASTYTHIIVDECQDMNLPQFLVVFALGQDHKNVMLVGDPDQSLYSFRGADSGTFQKFAAHRSSTVFELSINYRSTETIFSLADSLIRQDEERRVIPLAPARPVGEPVTWQVFPDPDFEALAIGEEILHLTKRGVDFKDIAVLYRMNAQSEAFERHFAALGIPFNIREDGDFYSRKEVRGILSYLQFFAGDMARAGKKAAANQEKAVHQDEWLLALVNTPNRKLPRTIGSLLRTHAEFKNKRIWDIMGEFHGPDFRSHQTVQLLQKELQRIEEKLKSINTAGDAIHVVRTVTQFDDWLRKEEKDDKENDRIQNIQRMQAAAAHYSTVDAYLEAVQRVREEAERRKSERAKKKRELNEVTLGTGHSAKGLEWRCVFAAGWSEEILPHRKAENIAEERRIAYVIATRARDILHISSLQSWNDAIAAPSRFLSGLSLTPRQAEMKSETGEDTLKVNYSEPEEMFGGLFME